MEPAWSITLTILAATLPSLLLVLLLYSLCKKLWRRYCGAPLPSPLPITRRDAALQRNALLASLWRSSVPLRAFQWSDHPSHVITALEHGWAAFAFSYAAAAAAAFHQMRDVCATCSAMNQVFPPEITWTEDCLQQIRLNPGVRSNRDGCVLPVQALQTALPVPGPVLGPVPYPQEAYFEMVVWNETSSECSSMAGSERVKLIAKTVTASDRYRPVTSAAHEDPDPDGEGGKTDEKELSSKKTAGERMDEDGTERNEVDWDEMLSVGLAGAEAPPFRLLGFDPGSVGFLSADGQCYVNGTPYSQGKDMMPIKGRPWGVAGKTVVGCGFEPTRRRVYFTINGELVHEAFLKSSDFANPLYPTIASNYDVTVSVNLGQRIFEYIPANVTRVANPCCRILQARPFKTTSFFDDGDIALDFFSMGGFDSHWLADLEYASTQERHCYGHSELSRTSLRSY